MTSSSDRTTATPDLDSVSRLYRTHRRDLARVRERQRGLLRTVRRAQLDDLEAEITYLLLRELRPSHVVEIGALHGWSTTWMLHALRDNGTGHLHSFDLHAGARGAVPDALAADRWTFSQGDVRDGLTRLPSTVDYLFLDAAHTRRFARWYLDNLFPLLAPGTPVSVHDVHHGRRPLPFTEGATVLRWLASHRTDHFTASAARNPGAYRALRALKRELGLGTPIRASRDNPMIFFTR